MQKVTKIKWKWRELIAALGGTAGVCEKIAVRGIAPPAQNTVKAWQLRNSVPGRWAPLLIMIGEEERIPETGETVLLKVSYLWGGIAL